MNISQLRRTAQEAPDLSAQAYLKVGGVLYPIANILVDRDSMTIVASEPAKVEDNAEAVQAELDADESLTPVTEEEATPETTDTFILNEAVAAAEGAGEITEEEADELYEPIAF